MVLGDRLEGVNVGDHSEVGVTVPDIKAYTQETDGRAGRYTQYELSGNGEPAQMNAARLTARVFQVLGRAAWARIHARRRGPQPARAVLSYGSWVERFHRDSNVVGTKILLDRKPYIIIGVMPRGFEFPAGAGQLNRDETWVPMSYRPEELAPAAANWSYNMVGRLKRACNRRKPMPRWRRR